MSEHHAQASPTVDDAGCTAPPGSIRAPVRLRSVVLGLGLCIAVCLWIHHAELILGSRQGHSALANTSIPLGAFFALMVLVGLNLILRRILPGAVLSQTELVTVYVMMTVSTVIASSGGIHFLVPALAAAFYFASPENNWNEFTPYIPHWFAPRDPTVLKHFYVGGSTVPVHAWMVPVIVWTAFLVVFAAGTICVCALLRRQWVDRERLTFPTVVLPLRVTEPGAPLLSDRLLWIGAAVAIGIGLVNTAHENIPAFPALQVRPVEVSQYFVGKPWDAIGSFALSGYPFVIGIAFLLSLEVTFSCWFFYLLTKVENITSAMLGLNAVTTGGTSSRFPFLDHQGAGAFLALVLFTLWYGRGHFKSVWLHLIGRAGSREDSVEPLSYRAAVVGVWVCFGLIYAFCLAAGMSLWVPLILFFLVLCYMIAATRVRAETGNAWLFGPQIDPHALVTRTFGTAAISVHDLTIMAYFQALTTYDLRCLSMPHQLDGFKMGDETGLNNRQLVAAMLAALVVSVFFSFWAGLKIWYDLGAMAKANLWRTEMGKQPFTVLSSYLAQPLPPDRLGTAFVALGAVITGLLMFMRTRFLWWPFHPVGYAVANTPTMRAIWLPFFIAWALKACILRYAGANAYRRALPFFLGLILGDFLSGGFWTLIACFIPSLKVYPINW